MVRIALLPCPIGIGPIQSLHSTGVEDKDISHKMNVIFVKKHDGKFVHYPYLSMDNVEIRPMGNIRIQARLFHRKNQYPLKILSDVPIVKSNIMIFLKL
jgi:hypothetical protein